MRTKKIVLAIVVIGGLVLAPNLIFAQTKLEDLMLYAIEHSRDVKKANLQIAEAKYAKKETLGQGLPQIQGEASFSKMYMDMSQLMSGFWHE